ncbi:hypothetical protein E8E11_000483 [Didymella keratinophila]|nr:hypothetical protein E8E11_000483 [Didymella keratinophila]
MAESLYQAAIRRQRVVQVYMNHFDIAYTGTDKPCIGTDQLGPCSVVLIASRYATILGHVAPLPPVPDPNDKDPGSNHVRKFMNAFVKLCRENKQYFPSDTASGVVCAIYDGEVALPDQQRIMHDRLSREGLSVHTSTNYVVPFTAVHPDRGSVFVDSNNSDNVKVYIEGRHVPELSPQPAQCVQPQGITQPQETSYWDGEYNVSTSNPAC